MATVDDDAMLDTLERWLASDVVPQVLELEHADEYPREMVEQMREFGLFAATIPEEFGGLGLSACVVRAHRRGDLARVDVAHRRREHPSDGGRARAAVRDRRAARAVPPASRRRRTARRARAHRARLRHRPPSGAHHRDAHRRWLRVRGTKMWITNAHEGNCLAVLAKTDPEPSPATGACRCSSCPRTSATPCRASSGSSATRASTPVRSCSTTSSSPTTTCSAAWRAAASTRPSARSSSGASTSPHAAWASPTPRSRRRSRTRSSATRWASRSSSTRRSRPSSPTWPAGSRRPASSPTRRRGRVRPGRAVRHGGGDGEAGGVGGGARERHRGDAHPRRLRLLHRGPRRALLPRRPAPVHRRGHQRDPAHHHRPPARLPEH